MAKSTAKNLREIVSYEKYELEMSIKLYGISKPNLHKDTRTNFIYFITYKK